MDRVAAGIMSELESRLELLGTVDRDGCQNWIAYRVRSGEGILPIVAVINTQRASFGGMENRFSIYLALPGESLDYRRVMIELDGEIHDSRWAAGGISNGRILVGAWVDENLEIIEAAWESAEALRGRSWLFDEMVALCPPLGVSIALEAAPGA